MQGELPEGVWKLLIKFMFFQNIINAYVAKISISDTDIQFMDIKNKARRTDRLLEPTLALRVHAMNFLDEDLGSRA